MKIIDINSLIKMNDEIKSRPPLDFIFMHVAMLFSTRADCEKLSVGCCIVKDDRIISCGYNGDFSKGCGCTHDATCPQDSTGSCLRAVHAEQNAISFCAKNGISTNESTIYITHSPCISCAKIIVQSGIKRVVYLEEYKFIEGIEYLKRAGIEIAKFSEINCI